MFASFLILFNSVFAPIGGFQAVTNAMLKLAEGMGIRTHCNTSVTGVDSDGVFLADGTCIDGVATNFMPADLVIVNAAYPTRRSRC